MPIVASSSARTPNALNSAAAARTLHAEMLASRCIVIVRVQRIASCGSSARRSRRTASSTVVSETPAAVRTWTVIIVLKREP